MRKEAWFGLSILALIVFGLFWLMPPPSQMTNGHLGLLMLALIVVGGMGSIPGAVLAALLLGVGETFLIGFANIPMPRDALAFIAMIAILMWRPSGLLGRR